MANKKQNVGEEVKTKVKIYKSYGVLAHEKQPVYGMVPASDIYDEITVEIPFKVWEGRGSLGVTLSGNQYYLHEVLRNFGDDPVLWWMDDDFREHRVKLEVVKD